MNEKPEPGSPAVAQAAVGDKPKFSLVWVVPIVAAIIGAWLVYKAVTEEGPTITIVFSSGDGITAGKTKIKYRSVEIGSVEEVRLTEDLSAVEVTAKMAVGAKEYLREDTQFYVVRARVAAGEVQGLGTLLSGAYIGMSPSTDGPREKNFVGLDEAPLIEPGEEGRRFRLRADNLGSLDAGVPVYYHQIPVGRVLHYQLTEDGSISAEIFVEKPYDEMIKAHTRFWNAGGIEAELGAEGFHLSTQSLTSILIGGVAFETPETLGPKEEVAEGHEFFLFENLRAAQSPEYRIKNYYLLMFEESVRGLKIGAPIEFLGLPIGEVVDVRFEADFETMEFRVPVLVQIEPERLLGTGLQVKTQTRVQDLVDHGMRAQLGAGNVLTGGKVINLVFVEDTEPAAVGEWGGYPTIPTIPSSLRNLSADIGVIVDKIEDIPFDEIGANLNETAAGISQIVNSPELTEAIASLRKMADQLGDEVAPALNSVLTKAEQTLDSAKKQIDADSVTTHELRRLLMELGDTAQAIRTILEYLERHPEALIMGKEE